MRALSPLPLLIIGVFTTASSAPSDLLSTHAPNTSAEISNDVFEGIRPMSFGTENKVDRIGEFLESMGSPSCPVISAAWGMHYLQGSVRQPLRIKEIPGAGCRVVATSRVPKNKILLTIPAAQQLSGTWAADQYPALHKGLHLLPDDTEQRQFLVAAGLLLEERKEDKSQFEMYIKMLPSAADSKLQSAVRFSDTESLCMHRLSERTHQDSKLLRFRAAWAAAGLGMGDMEWAMTIVHTRAIRVQNKLLPQGDITLVPLIDLFNHDPKKGVPISTSPGDSPGAFAIISGSTLEEGDEVFVTYGSMSPHDTLNTYGFVNQGTPIVVDPLLPNCPDGRLYTMPATTLPWLPRKTRDFDWASKTFQPDEILAECLWPVQSQNRNINSTVRYAFYTAAKWYKNWVTHPSCYAQDGHSMLDGILFANSASAHQLLAAAKYHTRKSPLVLTM